MQIAAKKILHIMKQTPYNPIQGGKMKKQIIFIAACILMIPFCATAQENDSAAQNYIGINLLHTGVIYLVSTSLTDTTQYLPLHFNYFHSFTQNWGLSALAFYRLDKDGEFRTNEFGFAVGPRFSLDYLKGFYIDCKLGLGLASGLDYSGNDYSRFDFVIEPDLGYNLEIGKFFSITFGLGLQTLVCISESPARDGTWDWNFIGSLSHYYLPVANLSAALLF
jgi:hypothetical protein